jgi:hypothetical protein
MWALTIDFWRSRGWQLIGTMLMLLLMPMFIYGPLFAMSHYDWQHDPVNVMMHVVLTGIVALGIVGSLLTWLPSQGHAYTLPITTWKLVVTRSVGGGLAAAVAYTLVCQLVNRLFQVAWPYWGPLLLIVTLYLAAQAVAWLTIQSQLLGVFALVPLCVLSAWWFGMRYESDELLKGGSRPMQMWTHVTWGEWTALLLVGGIGLWGSFHAARLQRKGSGPTMAGLSAALFGLSARSGSTELPRFTTCESALSWREWRERGRVIPLLFAAGVFVYGCLLLLLADNTQQAIEMGGGFSMLGAGMFFLLGMYLGHRSGQQDFLGFDATRPLTDAQWSRVLLRNMAKSTSVACTIWILGVGLLGTIAWIWGDGRLELALHNGLEHSFYPFQISVPVKLALMTCLWGLACWTFSANGMMIALLRRWATMTVVLGGMGSLFLTMLGIKLLLPDDLGQQEAAGQILMGTYATLALVATLGSFLVAWRRNMLGGSTCWICLAVWLLVASLFLGWMIVPLAIRNAGLRGNDWYGVFVISCLLMLPLLPIAGTPLAVAWNRHR